jgi:hypothetical protein
MNIKLSYEIGRQDYVDFNKYHYKKTKLKKTFITGGLVLVILQLGLSLQKFDLAATLISSTVFIILYFFLISRSLNKTKNIPKDDGSILGKKELEFSDAGISHLDKNSSGIINWAAVKSLQSSSKAIYLYTDTNMAIVIPKRTFSSATEIIELENYIKEKLNNA